MSANVYDANALRKSAKNARRQLSETQQDIASKKILEALLSLSQFNQARHIACYQAIDGELSLQKVIEEIWRQKKSCYLPKVNKGTKALSFHLYEAESVLSAGEFNIQEAQNSEHFDREQLDLVLMPLTAFDAKGNRLGMGGGYYDFSFQHLREQTCRQSYLIGIAHSCQEVDHIESEEWDIKPDLIIAV